MQGSMAGAIIGDGELILGEMVGQGAMGAVYRAHQTSLDRVVAVKLLKSVTDDSDLGHRLVDEARAAARIRHPRLVEVIDVGEDAALGPYVIYEFLPGDTFETYLDKTGKIDWADTYALAGHGLLEALEAIHAAGVIHRDVKPANLLANENGDYLLADLGLAVFEGRSAQTKTGAFFGTPGYLSPERISPKMGKITAACDVYAAAILMVRAMTGKLPFKGYTTMEVLQCQLEREITPAVLIEEGLPKELAPVLSWALLRDPAKRCGSARKLLDKLKDIRIGGETAELKTPSLTGGKEGETRVFSATGSKTQNTEPIKAAKTRVAKPVERAQEVDSTAAKAVDKGKKSDRRRFAIPLVFLFLCGLFIWYASEREKGPKVIEAKESSTVSFELLREEVIKMHPSCPPKKVAQLGKIYRNRNDIKEQFPLRVPDELVGLYHLMCRSLESRDYEKAWTYGRQLMRRKSPLVVSKPGAVIDKYVEAGMACKKWPEIIETLRPIGEDEGGVDGASAALIGRIRARLAIVHKKYHQRELRDALREFLPSLRRVIAIGGKRELKALDLLFVIMALGQKGDDKPEFIKINEGILKRDDIAVDLRATILMRSAQRLVLCWPAFKKDSDIALHWVKESLQLATHPDLRAELRAKACSVLLEMPITMHWENAGVDDREARVKRAYEEINIARREATSVSTRALVNLNYSWVLRYRDEVLKASKYLNVVNLDELPSDQRWWYWRAKYTIAYEMKETGDMASIMKEAYKEAPPEYLSNLDDIHKPK